MEEQSKEIEVQFGPCCFCGEDISQTDTDPCRVTVETVKGKWQAWYCHGKCFKEKIVEHPMDLSPVYF